MLTVGSLFSGIGGFDLGLERTGGFKTMWQCEIDPFCNKILEKHWPTVTRYTDVRTMSNIPLVDVICASPPCQPVSCAGKRKGAKDDRWMWGETYRIICEVRPEWVIVENVLGLLSAKDTEGKPGGLFTGILRDFSKSGYDVEWNVVSAASVGALHLRKRVFVIAHANSQFDKSAVRNMGYEQALVETESCKQESSGIGDSSRKVSDSDDTRRSEQCGTEPDVKAKSTIECGSRWNAESGLGRAFDGISAKLDTPWKLEWEDGVPRVTTEKLYRTKRLKALGNAIVPQCAELIGYYVLELAKNA